MLFRVKVSRIYYERHRIVEEREVFVEAEEAEDTQEAVEDAMHLDLGPFADLTKWKEVRRTKTVEDQCTVVGVESINVVPDDEDHIADMIAADYLEEDD